jgi:alkylation response protein AidB-like acyl-CoA dehydrogenase
MPDRMTASKPPSLVAAAHIADRILAPTAQEIDRATLVPRERFDPLADAGLFGIAGPAELGWLDLAPREARRVIATIGGGCGATFFSWVQHHGVVRTVRSSPHRQLRDELLPALCSGETIAGVAFAHLRRTDRRAVTARRIDGGWVLDGHAPWATSWGIADTFAIAAESEAGDVVWGLIPGVESATVRPTPLPLPVFAATGTVALDFDGCVVADDRIAAVEPLDAWRVADRRRASIGQPAVLGVADRAIRLLAVSRRTDDDPAGPTADALDAELGRHWVRDDEILAALSDPSPAADILDRASAHRAACLDLAHRATTALLAAVGGAGMELSHPAQRLAREATFYVIQAQTVDGRAATLLASTRPESGT